nr:protein MEI2-like 4 [Tanacetum cinerariifolium]
MEISTRCWFVMIPCYDIRAAQRAMQALQEKPLRRRKLDIHYSIPKENPSDKDINQGTAMIYNIDSTISNDELCHVFVVYGEVKEGNLIRVIVAARASGILARWLFRCVAFRVWSYMVSDIVVYVFTSDSPAPKLAKYTRKLKSTEHKVPPRPFVLTPITSAQPAPTSAPVIPQEKKCKQATKTSDKPTKAEKVKYSAVSKIRKPRSSLNSVAALKAKDVPLVELQVVAKDADYQKALEESMKTAYALPWCPLPPVVIRELESGKYQSLPEVPGKGKAKVTEKQVSHDLLSQAKKKSPVEQYIFHRRTFTTTGSFGENEPSYAEIERSKSETMEKVVPRADKVGQGESEGQTRPDPGAQAKGQVGSDTGAQDETYEVQTGSNPDETSKGQARPDPGNAGGEIQSIPSHVVYVGSDCEHMDLDAANVPPQPSQEQLDERFTTTVNPKPFKAITTETTTTTLPPPTAQQQSTTEAMMMKHIALEKSMNCDHSEELTQDLAEARKKKKKSRESPKMPHGSPPHQPPPPTPPARSFEASEALGASGSSQMPPPPPPSSTTQESLSKGSAAPSSLKTATSAEYQAWMTTDIKLRPSISLTPADVELDEDMAPDEQTGDIATFIDWFYKRCEITELKPQYLEGPAFEITKVIHPDVIHLQYQMEEWHNVSKPLPLGGPPGKVSIQSDFFFNKDLEYLRYGSKGSRPALSISKLKECKYDIAAMYGISHWWFQRQQFHIDRHTSEGDRDAVRIHMQILSVIRIKVFSLYGFDYIKKIVLRRADLNEHVIAERGFKYMYPGDFEDLYLLNLQGHVNNLPPKDNKIVTMVVNQWTRHLDESRFKYEVLDQKGRGSEQGVHVLYSEALEDKEDLP